MNTAAIAQHLNVLESAITEVQEWVQVLWVRVKGVGCRFVSKKVVEVKGMKLPVLVGSEKQVTWATEIRDAWVTAIIGQSKNSSRASNLALLALSRVESAKWFIDNRDMGWKLADQMANLLSFVGDEDFDFVLAKVNRLGLQISLEDLNA